MKFAERLNCLMGILNLSNVKLALALHVDPSLISHWRRGKRVPKAQSEYYDAMAHYFSSCAARCQQEETLFTAMGCSDHSTDLEKLILSWLKPENNTSYHYTQHLFHRFSDIEPLRTELPLDLDEENALSDDRVYLGNEGKRQAVLAIVLRILSNNRPQDIYYFSDQPTDWFYEDKLFYGWMMEALHSFAPGIRLTIIHPSGGGTEHIFQYINCMLPFYLYADTHSYYSPQYRRGTIRNFLLIAPGIAAVTASSVENNTQMPVLVHTKRPLIHSLANQFLSLREMSQIMVKTFRADQTTAGNDCNAQYLSVPGTVYYLGSVIGYVPLRLLEEKLDLYVADEAKKTRLKQSVRARREACLRHMSQNNHYMLISLATIEDIRNGKIAFLNSQSYFGETVNYTLADYRAHVQYLIQLMREYPLLHVAVVQQRFPHIGLMVNINSGAMLYRTKLPDLMLASEQHYLVEALFCCLEHEYEILSIREKNTDFVLKTLEERLSELDQAILEDQSCSESGET